MRKIIKEQGILSSVPKSSGTTKPVSSNNSLVSKTVNLYSDPANTQFIKKVTITSVNQVGNQGDVFIKTKEGGILVHLQYNCIGRKLFLNEGRQYTRVYNTKFESELNKTFCSKSSGGASVPKADYAIADVSEPPSMTEGKRVVRLTESELVDLVHTIINEQKSR